MPYFPPVLTWECSPTLSDGTQPATLHWASLLKEKWQAGCPTSLKLCRETEEWESAKRKKKKKSLKRWFLLSLVRDRRGKA